MASERGEQWWLFVLTARRDSKLARTWRGLIARVRPAGRGSRFRPCRRAQAERNLPHTTAARLPRSLPFVSSLTTGSVVRGARRSFALSALRTRGTQRRPCRSHPSGQLRRSILPGRRCRHRCRSLRWSRNRRPLRPRPKRRASPCPRRQRGRSFLHSSAVDCVQTRCKPPRPTRGSTPRLCSPWSCCAFAFLLRTSPARVIGWPRSAASSWWWERVSPRRTWRCWDRTPGQPSREWGANCGNPGLFECRRRSGCIRPEGSEEISRRGRLDRARSSRAAAGSWRARDIRQLPTSIIPGSSRC